MAEIQSCLVCKSTDFSELFTAKDYLVSSNIFIIKKCKSCGFTFTADPPDEKDITRFYLSEDYISHSDKKSTLTEYAYHFARHIMLRKKYKLTCKVCARKTGTLLDIGSGTGYFSHYMKKRGWNVTGIELNDYARNFSVSRFGIDALEPSGIQEIQKESVDCITFWHVLEHLYEPVKWINEVKRILKNDGKCIIALPNIRSADAEWFGNLWAALDVPRHLWHFSDETMTRLIKEHGLTCVMIKSMPMDIFYIAALSYRNQGAVFPLFRGMATGLLLSLGNVFRKNRASSLIYVISKQPD